MSLPATQPADEELLLLEAVNGAAGSELPATQPFEQEDEEAPRSREQSPPRREVTNDVLLEHIMQMNYMMSSLWNCIKLVEHTSEKVVSGLEEKVKALERKNNKLRKEMQDVARAAIKTYRNALNGKRQREDGGEEEEGDKKKE